MTRNSVEVYNGDSCQIKTVQQYENVSEASFEDDVITYRRMLILMLLLLISVIPILSVMYSIVNKRYAHSKRYAFYCCIVVV